MTKQTGELRIPIQQLMGRAHQHGRIMKYGRPTVLFQDALGLTHDAYMKKYGKKFLRYDGDLYEHKIEGSDFVVRFDLDKVLTEEGG